MFSPFVFPTVAECYQAAFETALERLSRTVDEAVGGKSPWLDRFRAGLVAFLGFLDDEPAWGRLLIAQTPVTDGALALSRQQCVLGVLTSLLDNDGPQAARGVVPGPLMISELLVGGVLSVVRTQMLKADGEALVGLAPSLMSFVVRPYLGPVAANAELEGKPSVGAAECAADPLSARAQGIARVGELPIRATHRTTLVLRAIGRAPYSNNREVAQAAGLSDEGQTSKLLARLERKGVIENVGVGAARGEPNAWLLTGSGRRAVELLGESFSSRATRGHARRRHSA